MHVHVRIEVFQSITGQSQIQELRATFGKTVGSWVESGKIVYSGIFSNKRGGIFVFEVKDADEIFDLCAPIVDFTNIEVQPLITIEKLEAFFKNDVNS